MQCYSQLWSWQTVLRAHVRAESCWQGWAATAPMAACQGSVIGKGQHTTNSFSETIHCNTCYSPAQGIQNVSHGAIK